MGSSANDTRGFQYLSSYWAAVLQFRQSSCNLSAKQPRMRFRARKANADRVPHKVQLLGLIGGVRKDTRPGLLRRLRAFAGVQAIASPLGAHTCRFSCAGLLASPTSVRTKEHLTRLCCHQASYDLCQSAHSSLTSGLEAFQQCTRSLCLCLRSSIKIPISACPRIPLEQRARLLRVGVAKE